MFRVFRQRRLPHAVMAAAMLCAGAGLAPSFALASTPPTGESLPEAAPGPIAPGESRPLGIPTRDASQPPESAGSATSTGGAITQTILALGGVLVLAVVGGALVRGIARSQGGLRASLGAGGRAPAGILEVVGRYPIARGSSLVLLKLDRRILLLSQSAQGRLGSGAAFSTLCEITDPEEVASILVKARDEDGDSMSERFRGILSRFDRTFDEQPSSPAAPRHRTSSGVDRVELWDENRADIPLVDLTRQPGPSEHGGPIASLRKRLASLRIEGGTP
jgi:hypothetical protein